MKIKLHVLPALEFVWEQPPLTSSSVYALSTAQSHPMNIYRSRVTLFIRNATGPDSGAERMQRNMGGDPSSHQLADD